MVELWNIYGWPAVIMVAWIGLIIGVLLMAVAYLTYAERKIMGAMQRVRGI